MSHTATCELEDPGHEHSEETAADDSVPAITRELDTTTSAVRVFCATCANISRAFTLRYRDFLLAPGTLVTATSALVLIIALIVDPGGLIGHGATGGWHHPIYLVAAVIGSTWIWWSAIQGIANKDFTADIPVSIATAAALAIGQYAAAAVVATLLLLGGLLEEMVAARAGKAIESLATLLPDVVTVRRLDGDLSIRLEEVVVSDLVIVRAGERVPVDGTVEWGTGALNEAVITGESLPVDKGIGAAVFAGSLNEAGAIEVRATKVGDETTLGQIRRMIAEAEQRKAPIERLLNRWAKFYTPAAIVLGLLLWWQTGDILRGITVLIVFCPCVMVLATPTALVAAIGNAALRGSLVKQGSTIETLARIDTVAFDKTGTLTHAVPRLRHVQPLGSQNEAELLGLAAAAEHFSEHPLARTIEVAALDAGLVVIEPDEFTATPGLGVRARIGDHEVVVGRLAFLAELGLASGIASSTDDDLAKGDAATTVFVVRDAELIGLLTFEDTVRREAQPTVAELQTLGVCTLMVTGDARGVARQLGLHLGIDDVRAELLPQDKVDVVAQAQRDGCVVAFVGDGVNDGPALVTADIGVAMGLNGTDVAIESAQIALLSDDLAKLPHLIGLARQALRAIYQNLAFSLCVLAAAIGLTVAGVLDPVSGALLHELSSIPVIANSARLINRR